MPAFELAVFDGAVFDGAALPRAPFDVAFEVPFEVAFDVVALAETELADVAFAFVAALDDEPPADARFFAEDGGAAESPDFFGRDPSGGRFFG